MTHGALGRPINGTSPRSNWDFPEKIWKCGVTGSGVLPATTVLVVNVLGLWRTWPTARTASSEAAPRLNASNVAGCGAVGREPLAEGARVVCTKNCRNRRTAATQAARCV